MKIDMKKIAFLLMLCLVVLLAAACEEKEKPAAPKGATGESYGYRKYYVDGEERVLMSEFTVEGNVRTLKECYGDKVKKETVRYYDETGETPIKETEQNNVYGTYTEKQYDAEGRVACVINRRFEGEEEARWADKITLPREFLDCPFSTTCKHYSWDCFYLWLQLGITDPEVCWDCGNCSEMREEYTYRGDSNVVATIVTTWDDEHYNCYFERGDGDIVLKAFCNSDESHYEETYDGSTNTGFLQWQTRDPETKQIRSVEGRKQYDRLGRLVRFFTQQGDESVEIALKYEEDGTSVRETTKNLRTRDTDTDGNGSKEEYVHIETQVYDTKGRRIRQETEVTTDGAVADKTRTEVIYDDAERIVRTKSYEFAPGTGECYLGAETTESTDASNIQTRYYREPGSGSDGREPMLSSETSCEFYEDPEIAGKVRCQKYVYYDENGRVSHERRSYSIDLLAYGVDWDFEYMPEKVKSKYRWEVYREEEVQYSEPGSPEEANVKKNGIFDSQGRLEKVEKPETFFTEYTEYDEKGRMVANIRTSVSGSRLGYEWEYWGDSE